MERIIDALGRILIRDGFTGVGVNAVAREASVDKVLIYRYFGSMEGLLEAFREKHEIAPGIRGILDEFPGTSPMCEMVTRLLLRSWAAFRKNKTAQEITRWELAENNPLTRAFSRSLEQSEMQALSDRGIFVEKEAIAAVVLLICGLSFITLRESVSNPVMGMDFSDPDTVSMIEKVVGDITRSYFTENDEDACC
jgi:AcrR family transcriptional regulator